MDAQKIHQQALNAAIAAADSCTPTPMVVGSPSTPWGNEIDHTKPTYFVADGPCGYAWVKIKGRGAFARWAKESGVARPSALGGYTIYPGLMTQSMERKEAWANAYAQVLRDHGIEAYVDSRLD